MLGHDHALTGAVAFAAAAPVIHVTGLPAVTGAVLTAGAALLPDIDEPGDELTHSGCPVLYPFSRRKFHLLPCGLRFTTGKLAEHRIVSPLLLVLLAFLLWRDAGAAIVAHAQTSAGK